MSNSLDSEEYCNIKRFKELQNLDVCIRSNPRRADEYAAEASGPVNRMEDFDTFWIETFLSYICSS